MEIALQRVKEPLANAQNPPQTALVLTKRHVMGDMEKSLVDRCLKRALDWSGKPTRSTAWLSGARWTSPITAQKLAPQFE